MPPLHENLRAAKGYRFLDLPVDLLVGDHVRIVVLLSAVKRTKLAVNVADVGVVDVAINNVRDDLSASTTVGCRARQLPAAVRQRTQFFQRNR